MRPLSRTLGIRWTALALPEVWGHSLGTGIAVAALAELTHAEKLLPTGLVLEAPFTSRARAHSTWRALGNSMGGQFGLHLFFGSL